MDRSTGIIVIVVTLLGLYLYYTGALKLPSLKTSAGPAGGTLSPASVTGGIGTPGIAGGNPPVNFDTWSQERQTEGKPPGTLNDYLKEFGLPGAQNLTSGIGSSLNNLDLAALLSPTATQAQPQGTTINIFNGGQTSPSSAQGIGIPGFLLPTSSGQYPNPTPGAPNPGGTPGIGGGTFPTLPGSNNPSAVQQRVGFAQGAAGPGGALTGSLGTLVQCHGVGNCIGKGALAAGVGALTLLTLGLL